MASLRYAAVVLALATLLPASCQLFPRHVDTGDLKKEDPQPDRVACQMIKAAQCAYNVERDGALNTGKFCPRLRNLKEGVGSIAKSGRDSGYLALYHDDAGNEDVAVLAFRGTLPLGDGKTMQDAVRDWAGDTRQDFDRLEVGGAPRRVHHGFMEAVNGTLKDLETTLQDWKTRGRYAKLYITGHSKGGAMAVLAAAKLQPRFAIEGVYAFAPARAGVAEFQQAYNNLKIPTVRYENENDVVPHLPPKQAEIDALHGGLHDLLLQFANNKDYEPAGSLVYIFGNLQVMKQDTPDLDKYRVHTFENRFAGQDFNAVLEDVVKAHSIDKPLQKDPEDADRYYRVACKGDRT